MPKRGIDLKSCFNMPFARKHIFLLDAKTFCPICSQTPFPPYPSNRPSRGLPSSPKFNSMDTRRWMSARK